MYSTAKQYEDNAHELSQTYSVTEYLSYFRKSKYKQIAKLFEKAAAEYTTIDNNDNAAKNYFSAAYNFMLADVLDKAAQCYILAAKFYNPDNYKDIVTAYLHAADIYDSQRRYQMTIKCFDCVAEIYLSRGLYRESIQFYENCVKIACREGYMSINFQEKIAVIQIMHFGYYATAITGYDSIIKKIINEPIVYPFMMISILLRILVNEYRETIDNYIDMYLEIKGFSTTDYYAFLRKILLILKSDGNKRKMIDECYGIYRNKSGGFNNAVVLFLISKIE